jgi:hypothetical protein
MNGMGMVARVGIAPTSSGLWAQQATTAPPRDKVGPL